MQKAGKGLRSPLPPNSCCNGNFFSKQYRILSRQDFLRIGKVGKKCQTRNFMVLLSVTENEFPRLGLTVSRKVGNAVTRNRIKRYVREFFRQHKQEIVPADYNVIARQGAAHIDYQSVCKELDQLLKRRQA